MGWELVMVHASLCMENLIFVVLYACRCPFQANLQRSEMGLVGKRVEKLFGKDFCISCQYIREQTLVNGKSV